MTTRPSAFRALALVALFLGSAAQAASLTMTKTPGCGCCNAWAEHVRRAGIAVKVVESANLNAYRAKMGVPANLASCHTAVIGGYVVEGHVPVADIQKLLREKPKARGIAVAGMPMGSPGMEHGDHKQPYVTMLIGKDGSARPYVRH